MKARKNQGDPKRGPAVEPMTPKAPTSKDMQSVKIDAAKKAYKIAGENRSSARDKYNKTGSMEDSEAWTNSSIAESKARTALDFAQGKGPAAYPAYKRFPADTKSGGVATTRRGNIKK